jgi:hypothetical protein
MNYARVVTAGVAAWVASMAIGFVINTYVLAGVFDANAAAMRPESEIDVMLPFGFVALLFAYLAFAYIYAATYKPGNGWADGARLGVVLAVAVSGLGLVWQYILYPINPAMLAVLVGDSLVETALYGAIIGAVYKPK